MFDKIVKFLLPEPRTNLDIVLEKIHNQDEVRSANMAIALITGNLSDINIDKDLHFMVGKVKVTTHCMQYKYFRVKFGDRDRKCVITMGNDADPLFTFNEPEEIEAIRKALKNKYKDMRIKEEKSSLNKFNSI